MYFNFARIIPSRIVDSISENDLVKSIYVFPKKKIPKPNPGQFFMIWVPGYEEIPISASGYFNGIIRFSIAKVGETTKRLHQLGKDDFIGIKGPLGNSIPIKEASYLLVGGGYGSAPLIYATRELLRVGADVIFAEGAKSASSLVFIDEAIELGVKVVVATEDGSFGYKGVITNYIGDYLKKVDIVIACGPEGLLRAVSELAIKEGKESYVIAESYMKCGIGLCGSCVLGNSGLLVCKDGPVFKAEVYLRAITS